MKHEILGEIEPSESDVIDGVARVQYGGREVKVQLLRDGEPLEVAMQLAAEVVRQLATFDGLAKRVATAELREMYNSGWREYDEMQADGTVLDVSNPSLSEAEFEAKLSLYAVNVSADQMINFFYDDEGMFAGHSVVVHSLKGVDLSEAYAELFG